MICKNCKATIPDDSAFCMACGSKVSPSTAPAELNESTDTPHDAVVNIDEIAEVSHEQDEQPKRASAFSFKAIALILAAVALLCIICLTFGGRIIGGLTAIVLTPVSAIGLIVQVVRKKSKKAWGILLGFACSILFLIFSIPLPCEHIWLDATCTTLQTCSECGKERGELLEHEFEAATCTKPQTCRNCGYEQGLLAEHTWNEATCNTPSSCSQCGTTTGNALGHDLQGNACTRCNASACELLGHTAGTWTPDDPDLITASVWTRQRCEVCSTLLESKLLSLSTLHENGKFLLSPEEFSERLGKVLSVIGSEELTTNFAVTPDGTMGCAIMAQSKSVGIILFMDDTNIMEGDSREKKEVTSMVCEFSTEDISILVEAMVGIVLSSDCSLEVSDAADVCKNIVIKAYTGSYIHKENGISYMLENTTGAYRFYVSVLQK